MNKIEREWSDAYVAGMATGLSDARVSMVFEAYKNGEADYWTVRRALGFLEREGCELQRFAEKAIAELDKANG